MEKDDNTIEVPEIIDLNGFLCEGSVAEQLTSITDNLLADAGSRTITDTVFLMGPRGVGKTTALNYIVSRIAPGDLTAIYGNALVYDGFSFAQSVVHAIEHNRLQEAEDRAADSRLLCIDASDHLLNKTETSAVLERIVSVRQKDGRPTVIVGDSDLLSRLPSDHPWTIFVSSMITVTLPCPSYPVRRRLISHRASRIGTSFSVRTEHIVAERMHGDMHALNSIVDLLCIRKAFHPDGLPEEVVAAVIRRE